MLKEYQIKSTRKHVCHFTKIAMSDLNVFQNLPQFAKFIAKIIGSFFQIYLQELFQIYLKRADPTSHCNDNRYSHGNGPLYLRLTTWSIIPKSIYKKRPKSFISLLGTEELRHQSPHLIDYVLDIKTSRTVCRFFLLLNKLFFY